MGPKETTLDFPNVYSKFAVLTNVSIQGCVDRGYTQGLVLHSLIVVVRTTSEEWELSLADHGSPVLI